MLVGSVENWTTMCTQSVAKAAAKHTAVRHRLRLTDDFSPMVRNVEKSYSLAPYENCRMNLAALAKLGSGSSHACAMPASGRIMAWNCEMPLMP